MSEPAANDRVTHRCGDPACGRTAEGDGRRLPAGWDHLYGVEMCPTHRVRRSPALRTRIQIARQQSRRRASGVRS